MSNIVKGGLSLERLQHIDSLMEGYVKNTHFPGIVTLLYRKGELVHHQAYGLLGSDPQHPMPLDGICRIYSMTKPIICTAFLMLYEQGKCQLFDPVSWYIPSFRNLKVFAGDIAQRRKHVSKRTVFRASELVNPIREVTIHDLLTHTSGITFDCNDSNKPLAEFVEDLTQVPLAFQPGSQWHYGYSHDVIARLIEVLSGQPLNRFLEENIYQPLAMKDTGYYVPPEKHDRFAAMIGANDLGGIRRTWELLDNDEFRWLSDPEKDMEYRQHEIFRGGHGLVSTAADYLQFCRMLLNQGELEGQRILSRKTVELMTTNQLPDSHLPFDIDGKVFWGYGYGLGVRVLIDLARSQILGSLGEFGWGGVASTFFWIDPVEEMIGIFMSQVRPESYYAAVDDFWVQAYQAIVD
jgi:CubicO group peptidase (beta-lactamase class C family)